MIRVRVTVDSAADSESGSEPTYRRTYLYRIGDPATDEACLKASDQVQLELKRASLIKEGLERNILCIP